jgi:hypothetical protein
MAFQWPKVMWNVSVARADILISFVLPDKYMFAMNQTEKSNVLVSIARL